MRIALVSLTMLAWVAVASAPGALAAPVGGACSARAGMGMIRP